MNEMRRQTIFTLFIALIVLFSARVSYANSDYDGPELTNIVIAENGQKLSVGDTVHVSVRVADESGIESVSGILGFASSGYYMFFDYNEATGLWESSVTFREDSQDGKYTITWISSSDNTGNMTSMAVDDQYVEFEGGVTDITGPELTNIVIAENGQKLTVGDTVHVSVRVADESGIQSVSGTLGFASSNYYMFFNYNEATGLWESSVTFRDDSKDGKYTITWISSSDNAGNMTSMEIDDQYVEFEGGVTDIIGPELTDIKIAENGQKLSVGDTVHVSVRVADESGIESVSGILGFASSGYYMFFDYNEATGLWESSATFRDDSKDGKYTITWISSSDKYGNDTATECKDQFVYFMGPNHKHKLIAHPAKPATSISVGNSAYWSCFGCDKFFSDADGNVEIAENSWVINVINHELTEHKEIAATCTATGNSAYWSCSTCEKYFADAEAKHEIVADSWVKPALGHKLIEHPKAEASCTEDGVEAYWNCSVCGKLYADKNTNYEIDKPIAIPKLAHTVAEDTAIAASCTETGLTEGKHCSVCNTVIVAQEIIPATGHTEAVDAAKAPTCTETGLTEGKHCSVCEMVVVAQQLVPALGHTEVVDLAVEPTYTTTGLTEGKHCSVCGEVLAAQKIVPKVIPVTPEQKIEAFVTRCYQVILGREPDPDGLQKWCAKLSAGTSTASEIIIGFISSTEYQNKKLSNEQSVEDLYRAMLDRGSDPIGKASWMAELNRGNPLAVVINGFCGSDEFIDLCNEYGLKPGNVEVKTEEILKGKIKAFISRCYMVILGREADSSGLETWTNAIFSGRSTASEIIDDFVNSAEFLNKKLTNEQTVEVLYQAMLGRASDPAGKNYWMSALHVGNPFAVIINGFCGSQEFMGLCSEYGIQPGSVQTGETIPFDPNWVAPDITKIQAYVTRCYKVILSRDPDPSGLADWTNQLYSGKKKAAEIIDGFVNSQEFLGKNLSNEDAVEVLYNAMLGRGSDAAGKADWVGKLNEGNPYASVINGFCGSQEFMALCKEYGIEPGSVAVTTLKAASPAPEEADAEESADVPAEPAAETEATAEPETQAPAETEENTVAEAASGEPAAADTEPAPSDPAARSKANGLKQDKVEAFVLRCYRIALNREPGADELDRYVTMIMDGKKSVRQVVQGFIFSDEFKARNLGNEEIIRILYRLYLDREADEEGLAHWLAALNDAGNLGAIVNSFAGSSEFNAAMQKMRR